MVCPTCSRPIESTHRFCGGCGESLADVTTPDVDGPSGTEPTGAPLPPPVEQADAATLPHLSDLPTRQIDIRSELPEPQWARPDTIRVEDNVVSNEPVGVDERFGSSGDVEVVQAGIETATAPPLTETVTTSTTSTAATVTRSVPPTRPQTAQMPIFDTAPPLFDGATDVRELPPGREPFRLKFVFLLAIFGTIAAVMASAATMVDLRTSIPVDGIATGPRLLDDLGTNLAVGGFVGVTVMIVGGLLSCFGYRWGGGLAGGGGLAVAGWAAVTIGLAELPISAAEATTRASPIPFTLKVTRDLGVWLVLIAGVIGVLVFLASLRSIRSGGHPPHNPWVAAVGAVSGVILVAGPLLPVGDAELSDNFQSANAVVDLPTLYFAGRLVQLGLILMCVVVGLLIVRAYGLGVAAGGVSVAVWMWLSALLELQPRPPGPMGIAIGNFGAADTSPHAVTTVGVVLTVAMLLIAAVLAGAGHFRHRHRRP